MFTASLSVSVLLVPRTMNRFLCLLCVWMGMLCAWPFLSAQAWSVEALFDQAIAVDVPPGAFRYNWRDAVLLKSFIDIYRVDPQQREHIASYIRGEMERCAEKAHGYHPNGVASAVGLAFLKEIGADSEKTREALSRVERQYGNIARAANGACSHRTSFVELWDDTLYMIGMFLTGSYQATGDASYLHQLSQQVLAHAEHLCDNKTGLWYHGWAESMYPTMDECCQYAWNSNPSHRNSEFWGRGNGWVAMTMVDLLALLPADDADYASVKALFVRMMNTLSRLQDKKTGLWYQLPAHPRDKENFLESSCTAMFGYAAAKGARLGILSPAFSRVGKAAYEGLIRHCLEADGTRLGRICAGTCIGDKSYYYHRDIVAGTETYATGAVLMLSCEIELY